jgi:hypothetical protein
LLLSDVSQLHKHSTATNFRAHLSCTSYTKDAIKGSSSDAVALTTQMREIVAILRNPEIYPNRKEEIATQMFVAINTSIHQVSFGWAKHS